MWDGFTEDDIRKYKTGEYDVKGHHPVSSTVPVVKRQFAHLRGSVKKNIARERMLQKPPKMIMENKFQEEIPEGARLSRNTVNAKQTAVAESSVKNTELEMSSTLPTSETSLLSEDPCESSLKEGQKLGGEVNSNTGPVCIKIKEGKNYELLSSDKSPLDEFQTRHKLMEEQNRRRKELLSKALADRKKQTHAEARRLQHIQEELHKLDALLSNDVGILRNQIEAASLEFMDAQKRYDKAEKEFLEAKLNLFSKLERKELLTEHLYKIIEQNEMRKARKLSELMDKLDLGNMEHTEETQKNTIGSMILPTLCALDEVSYSACNTLKSRQIDISRNQNPPLETTNPNTGLAQSNENVSVLQTDDLLKNDIGSCGEIDQDTSVEKTSNGKIDSVNN